MDNKCNLPEKEYFSLNEVAERWECSLDRVSYYVNEGLLRVAIESTNSSFRTLQNCHYYKSRANSFLFQRYRDDFWMYEDDLQDFFESMKMELDEGNVVFLCPRFLYLVEQQRMFSTEPYSSGPTQGQIKDGIYPATKTHVHYLASHIIDERLIPIRRKRGALKDDLAGRLEKNLLTMMMFHHSV